MANIEKLLWPNSPSTQWSVETNTLPSTTCCALISTNRERSWIHAKDRTVLAQVTVAASNHDIEISQFDQMSTVVRRRTDALSAEEFCRRIRLANPQQGDFSLTLLEALLDYQPRVSTPGLPNWCGRQRKDVYAQFNQADSELNHTGT